MDCEFLDNLGYMTGTKLVSNKKEKRALERWLNVYDHWLLLQRTWLQFPAATMVGKSSPRAV